MYRVLVVEDNTEFYEQELLRFFDKLLPMDKLEIVRAGGLEEALTMVAEPWDMVLVDYFLGAAALGLPTPDGEESKRVKHGADFVEVRRRVEAEGSQRATIVGISNVTIGNALIVKAGADCSHNKGLLEEITREVGRGLETHG
jgi:CheY-like chemotaxis protein